MSGPDMFALEERKGEEQKEEEPPIPDYEESHVMGLTQLYEFLPDLLTSLMFFDKQERDRVMVERMSEPSFKAVLSDEKLCVICLDNPPDSVLSCLHKFCAKCITDWQRVNLSCPLCRVDMDRPSSGKIGYALMDEMSEQDMQEMEGRLLVQLERILLKLV